MEESTLGQVRHGGATTTHAVRAAIQRLQASLSQLSRKLGISPQDRCQVAQTNDDRGYEDEAKLGVDFVSNPMLLLEPVHATEILVIGMKEGWFTGKKLSDYITLQRSDFVEARRIVNGKDKASEIARIAREYDRDLKAEGYGEEPIKEIINISSDNNALDAGIDRKEITPEKPEPVAKSKRFWIWITAAALPALGLLDWRVQLASVVIVGGIAGWAIYSMPQVKAKLSTLVEAL